MYMGDEKNERRNEKNARTLFAIAVLQNTFMPLE